VIYVSSVENRNVDVGLNFFGNPLLEEEGIWNESESEIESATSNRIELKEFGKEICRGGGEGENEREIANKRDFCDFFFEEKDCASMMGSGEKIDAEEHGSRRRKGRKLRKGKGMKKKGRKKNRNRKNRRLRVVVVVPSVRMKTMLNVAHM